MLLNCGVGEDSWESPLDCKEIQLVYPKGDQSWVFIGRTDVEAETPIPMATWCEELTHCKRPWCWERLKAGGEGDDRGWDGWMTSPTQWTWAWVSSGSWWWTGRPGVLQSVGSQRFGHDWVTELNWTDMQPMIELLNWKIGQKKLPKNGAWRDLMDEKFILKSMRHGIQYRDLK